MVLAAVGDGRQPTPGTDPADGVIWPRNGSARSERRGPGSFRNMFPRPGQSRPGAGPGPTTTPMTAGSRAWTRNGAQARPTSGVLARKTAGITARTGPGITVATRTGTPAAARTGTSVNPLGSRRGRKRTWLGRNPGTAAIVTPSMPSPPRPAT